MLVFIRLLLSSLTLLWNKAYTPVAASNEYATWRKHNDYVHFLKIYNFSFFLQSEKLESFTAKTADVPPSPQDVWAQVHRPNTRTTSSPFNKWSILIVGRIKVYSTDWLVHQASREDPLWHGGYVLSLGWFLLAAKFANMSKLFLSCLYNRPSIFKRALV